MHAAIICNNIAVRHSKTKVTTRRWIPTRTTKMDDINEIEVGMLMWGIPTQRLFVGVKCVNHPHKMLVWGN